jgi:hypothetical protein
MGASPSTRINVYLNAMEISQFTFIQEDYGYDNPTEDYAYRVLGFSGSTLRSFSEE